ncbi:carbohydrate ABC transporter permease [uncultured Alsobacter sp.]|uniref:carbohydrate ABC transporter permease n=1 Tax=uncultured Alsobacter sp. TaxID=1748258 RepID=UPI0025D4621A|nr:sugar ABC transporter permease [uncultured Alsobacter sp.]
MRQRALAFGLLAPALAIVAFTTVYPMLSSFWTSFHILNLSRSIELGRFIGIENYTEAFNEDPEFWQVMRVTAAFVVLDVTFTILAALGLAILLLRQGFGTSILRTLLILPFAMSPALIGISWRFMLNPDFGAFNRTIAAVLPFMRNTDYLASPTMAMGALISADVWHWAPYFTFMLMGGLASIPPETQEAARIDGASDWRVFRDVTLPQLAPVLLVAIILKSVFALKVFDSIVTMTGGGPGRSTTTLAFFAYHIGFRDYQFGYAAAVAYVLTAILFLFSLSYMRFAFRRTA